ncbi:MAG: (d)CMP kinase [Chlamydiota bacterium]
MKITIDGPSGTGKSSAAKLLAQRLGIAYLDTGAMYRCFAWHFREEGYSSVSLPTVEAALGSFSFEVQSRARYLVGKVDVTESIRSEEISSLSSQLSSFQCVRKALTKMQRERTKGLSCVCEGRDMGSVVFPHAEVKFFLTADSKTRAKRRYDQLQAKMSLQEIEKRMQRRDHADEMRKESPLEKTEDMIEIDTSFLSLEQVVLSMLQKVPPKKMRFFYSVAFFFGQFLARRLYRFEVRGKEHLFAGAALVIANHTSYFDPPLAVFALGEELHFLARKTLFRSFLFRCLISSLKAHPITAGKRDLHAVKTTLRILENGEKLLLFPEGGRSDGKQILPLAPGIGLLAFKSGCPVLPVYIAGAGDAWGKNRRLPHLFGTISCRIGPPITFEQYKDLGKKVFMQKVVEDARRALQDLEDATEAGNARSCRVK